MVLEGVCLVPGGVCSGWCVPGPEVSGGGVPGLGGCLLRGVCIWSGGSVCSRGVPGLGGIPVQVLPPCGRTDACKLITLPQTSFAGSI